MKQAITLKLMMAILAGSFAFYAMAADPVVSDVTVRQQWPWSRLVDIDYMLTGEQGERMDVLLTAMDGLTTLSLPTGSLSGDLYNVVPGLRRIVWDPMKTSYTNQTFTQFRADLAATVPPLYMIVDLTNLVVGGSAHVEYVYESDLTNGVWGAWVRNPLTNALGDAIVESVVWTGVTTNDIYKTDKIVLRRVPAGSYTMGGDGQYAYAVKLTKACYAGVFEVTEAQWGKVMGGGTTSKPKVSVSYNDIRGATNAVPAVNWPNTDRTVVTSGSFLGQFRSQTGIDDFDLPTEAQWEYLCRAGTTTVFNDGSTDAHYDGIVENNNAYTNSYLSALGWYKYNCAAAQPVGLKAANAWGLYDMHGNGYELCLDWYFGMISGGTDPSGAVAGVGQRVKRGGCWQLRADYCRSSRRHCCFPTQKSTDIGFRLVRTLP